MSAREPKPGSVLGGFVLERRLGEGATGVVFAVTRQKDGRSYAMKVLGSGIGRHQLLQKRFRREARVLRKLKHPRIVRIKAYGIENGNAYIAMEKLKGETLEQRLVRSPLPPADILQIMFQILPALHHAHEQGVIHRDLKPANVFLVDTDDLSIDARLLDFGLAKFLSDEDAIEEGTLTRSGRVVGTPAYMAPEQITGTAVDARLDVYAAGVMLFELIADVRPFSRIERTELLRAHLFEPVPPMLELHAGLAIEPALEKVVRCALEKDPARRYPDAEMFCTALKSFGPESINSGRALNREKSWASEDTSSVVIFSEDRESAIESEELAGRSEPPPGRWGKRFSQRWGKRWEKRLENWREAAWVTAAVWCVGLVGLAVEIGVMVWSAVTLR